MTKPEHKEGAQYDVRAALNSASPNQIARLIKDILNSNSNDDFNQTGTA